MRKNDNNIGKKIILLFLLSVSILLISLSIGVKAHYFTYGSFGASLSFDIEPPAINEVSTARIQLIDDFGQPIKELDTVHERKMHIFIVGQDLNEFAHLHPDDFPYGLNLKNLGIYLLEYNFSKAGNYIMVVDYTTQGNTYLQLFNFNVVGEDKFQKPKFDFKKEKKFGNYEVKLNLPEVVTPNKDIEASYHLKKNGQEVNDIQMLLGSEMHVLFIDENLANAGHTHAYRPGHYVHVGNMTQRYSGPTIPVILNFPQIGKYVIFSQFMHNNETITTKFMVKVEPDMPFNNNKLLFVFLVILFFFIIYKAGRYIERNFSDKK